MRRRTVCIRLKQMDVKRSSEESYRKLIESMDSSQSLLPSGGELFRFTNPSLSSISLTRLHEEWTNGHHLMDVTIRVGDHQIRAQKNILSAVSRYFETLFSANSNDHALDVIELSDVNGNAVEMLVQYAHTGSVDITGDNVSDLMRAANFLCIDSVTDACCMYLENNLTVDNCLNVQRLCISLGQTSLRDSVERFIVENFKDLTVEDHLMKMSADVLVQLLERDDFVVMGDDGGFYGDASKEEEKILEMVLRYVESDAEGGRRSHHLPSLLSRGVRLKLLSPSRLEALKSSQLIARCPESLRLISRVLSLDADDDDDDEENKKEEEEESRRWRQPRIRLVLHHQKTKVLAGTVLLQSEIPGEVFDDSKLLGTEGQCIYVTGLKISTRLWGDGRPIVGGLKIFYNTGRAMVHGTDGYGYEDHEFHLDQGERITAINASTGWLIDRITFGSNLGKTYGPYGGYGGTQHYMECPCKGAYLAYVTGSVETIQGESAVRHIRFIWGYYTR